MPRRTIEQVQADEIAHDAVHSRLQAIRNSWCFANVYQFIFLFGSELKIDNEIDIDVFEEECLKPEPSQVLSEIGLCLLKWVSSHRGLTLEIFEEYTRRQYLAKAPESNPFGDGEEPVKFRDLDLFTKLNILHQLSVWVFWNPDRMREKSHETDHTQWRMDPLGYDSKARAYYVLDDNRLYRMSFPTSRSTVAKKSQPKPSSGNVSRRSSKRQKMTNGTPSAVVEINTAEEADGDFHPDETLGGAMWECLAVTLEEYQTVVDRLKTSKHPDEREIVLSLREDVLPELERAAESKKRKHAQRMRDMENMQRLATAKRSSRIAGKAEKQRAEDEQLAAEEKRAQDLALAHAEQDRQQKLDEARESRMQTREQRLKDREVRRILHEEELQRLERGESIEGDGSSRLSERNREKQMEQKQRDLDALKRETVEDEWYFDCSGCGAVGKNFEDNKDSIACEKCGVWQHSACHGIQPEEASREDYQFICHHCANYPNGVRINVKQPTKASRSPKGAKSSRPADSSKSTKMQGVHKTPKRGPGRPRKQPQVMAEISTGRQPTDIQASLSSAPGLSNGDAFPNGLYRQQSTHSSSVMHDPGTRPAWQTETMPPYSLTPTSVPAGQPGLSGPGVDAAALYKSSISTVSTHQHNGALSQTPVSKSNIQSREQLTTPGQAVLSPSQIYGATDAVGLPHATPRHANPVDAPSSAASTRFAPSPQAGSNAAMSGKSPIKQDPHVLTTSTSSSFGGGTLSFQQGSFNATERSSSEQAGTPGTSSLPTLCPAPVLSPSVNVGPPNGQVPMKKPTPVKSMSGETVPPVSDAAAAAPRPGLG